MDINTDLNTLSLDNQDIVSSDAALTEGLDCVDSQVMGSDIAADHIDDAALDGNVELSMEEIEIDLLLNSEVIGTDNSTLGSPIRIEAEEMTLNGYQIESNTAASGNGLISLFGGGNTGSATTEFSGAEGKYDVLIGYFDEQDGQSPLSVEIGENQYSFIFDEERNGFAASSQTFVERTLFSGLNLTTGDAIAISGQVNQQEYARVDYIEFIPVGDTPDPTPNPGSLSFSDPSFSVNEDGTVEGAITIIRTNGSDGEVSVTLTPTNGTASAPDDYSSSPIIITFADGEVSQTISIPVVDDDVIEENETINLSLSAPAGGATLASQDTAVLTIVDNDEQTVPPTNGSPIRIEAEEITITGYQVESNTAASGNGLISLFGGDNTGTATTEFSGAEGQYDVVIGYFDEQDGQSPLLVEIGENQYSFIFDEERNGFAASSQTFVERTLFTGLNLTTGDAIAISGQVNLGEYARVDYIEFIPVGDTPDPTPNPGSLSFSDPSFSVNEDGTVEGAITIIRTNGSDGEVSVTLTPTNGTASAPDDYSSSPIIITFADGEVSQTISIPVVDDDVIEENETINLSLSAPAGGATVVGQDTAVLTIVDNDEQTVPPTNGSPIRIEAEEITITGYQVESNTAASGNGLISLFGGENTGTATTEFSGAEGQYDVVIGYFDEQDGQSPLSVEIGENQYSFIFDEDRNGFAASSQTFVERTLAYGLNLTTGDAIAISGEVNLGEYARVDYLEFIPTAETPDPTPNPGVIGLETSTISVNEEDGNAVVTVVRNQGSDGIITVDYRTVDSSATADADYTAQSGTLTFADGETSKSVIIPILDDELSEENETFGFAIDNVTGGASLLVPRTATVTIVDNETVQPSNELPPSSEPPTGTSIIQDTVVSGLVLPTAIDWTSDGEKMFVAEKNGVVRLFENGTLSSTPFIDISARVNSARDRGLLDIAVHPDFPNNPYVYLLYTYDPPEVFNHTGLAGPDGRGNRAGRLTRVTADPNTNYTTAIEGSEVILLGKNSTWDNFNGFVNSTNDFNEPAAGILPNGENLQDFLAADSESHTVGSVEFGADGALYVSNGDGTSFNQIDPRTFRVQDIDNLSGKILRIDPITGEGLTDNPFYNGDSNSNPSKVYQYGLRNPFRFTVDPETNQLFVGDVGWTLWEEINSAGPGANFGWPYYEGGNGESLRAPGYQFLSEAEAFYATGEETTPAILALNHTTDGINAIVMGDVYTGDAYPEEYRGDLFFNDLGQGIVRNISFDAEGNITSVDTFTTGANVVVQIVMGPDGNLHYVDLDDGVVGRWLFV